MAELPIGYPLPQVQPMPKCCGAALVHGFGYDTLNGYEDGSPPGFPKAVPTVREAIAKITENFKKREGVFAPYTQFKRPDEAVHDPSAYWSGRRSHLIAYLSEFQMRRYRDYMIELGWRVVDKFSNAKSGRKVFLMTLSEEEEI